MDLLDDNLEKKVSGKLFFHLVHQKRVISLFTHLNLNLMINLIVFHLPSDLMEQMKLLESTI